MDASSTFLNEELEEEVYIEKLEGFPLTKEKDMVCILKKALYGLKQAPRTGMKGWIKTWQNLELLRVQQIVICI